MNSQNIEFVRCLMPNTKYFRKKGPYKNLFTAEAQRTQSFCFFCFSLRRRKAKRLNPSGNKMSVSTPCNQRIYVFCCFRSVSCLVLFYYRPLNGNGKIIILCVLRASNERSEWAVNINSYTCIAKLGPSA
jgi:hypothetical protein